MYSEARVPVMSTVLAMGAIANILLVGCMAHTWKFWRQVKWYVILLLIGNILHVVFTQGITLNTAVTHNFGVSDPSTSLCRFMTFVHILGPSLSAMATAALALHVLLTSMTGNQGTGLRHALVMGLFTVLALVMPLTKIPFFKSESFYNYEEELHYCTIASSSYETHLQLQIGESVTMVFFPLLITICCVIAAAIMLSRSGNEKGDEDKSDVILAGLMGGVLLVFCVPFYISMLVVTFNQPQSVSGFDIVYDLMYLLDCSAVISAIIAIVFAYAHAYRSRGEFLVIPGSSTASTGSGERQKLVN